MVHLDRRRARWTPPAGRIRTMDSISIKAEARSDFGKGWARKLRRQARIPATIYRDGNQPTHVSFDERELVLLYRKANNPNLVLGIDVDGETITAILKDSQRHPVSRRVQHVDFYQVIDGVEVTVEVPVRTVGRAAGATLGGQLRMLRRTVTLRCKPEHIPAVIEIDITPLNIDDFVRASELQAPPNTALVIENEYNILTIDGKRARAAAEEAEEEEEEAAE